jgi:tetratricopeptide (TPR) repeat protein
MQTASLYGLLSKFKQSTLYYKRAFNEFPNVEVARKIVFNLLQLDKPEEAWYYLKYLDEKQPDDQMTSILLKKTEEVIRLKAQLLADPANSNAIFGLADYYLFLRNSTEAKKYLEMAIAKYPDNQMTVKLQSDLTKLISGNMKPD